MAYLHDGPRGRPIGFRIPEFSLFLVDEPAYAAIWQPPCFDAPQLGLVRATVGEICLATGALLGDEPSLNRAHFNRAVNADGDGDYEGAAHHWRMCLECGDQMAHYGRGMTLLQAGDARGAYRHLRAYTEVASFDPWGWLWLAKACVALGSAREAKQAARRALGIERDGGTETGAEQLLTEIQHLG